MNSKLLKIGVVLLLPSLIITFISLYSGKEIPSDEIDVGKIVINKLIENEPANSQVRIAGETLLNSFLILKIGLWIITILFILLGLFT